MEKGYITLPRTIFISEEWLQPRIFSKVEAWGDIVASVRFSTQPTTITVCGKTVVWQKDCWPVSLRTLAKRWLWTVSGVRSFLSMMAQNDRITLMVENGITIIRFKGDGTTDGTGNGTADGTGNGTAGETAPTESKETEMKYVTVANALRVNEKGGASKAHATVQTQPAHCDMATPRGTPCGTASDTAGGTIQNKGLIEERININDNNACARVREEMREMGRSNSRCIAARKTPLAKILRILQIPNLVDNEGYHLIFMRNKKRRAAPSKYCSRKAPYRSALKFFSQSRHFGPIPKPQYDEKSLHIVWLVFSGFPGRCCCGPPGDCK